VPFLILYRKVHDEKLKILLLPTKIAILEDYLLFDFKSCLNLHQNKLVQYSVEDTGIVYRIQILLTVDIHLYS